MYLKELTIQQFTAIYKTHMITDFPQDELKPLERMIHTMQTGLSSAFGLYENNDLRAYAVFIVPEGQSKSTAVQVSGITFLRWLNIL